MLGPGALEITFYKNIIKACNWQFVTNSFLSNKIMFYLWTLFHKQCDKGLHRPTQLNPQTNQLLVGALGNIIMSRTMGSKTTRLLNGKDHHDQRRGERKTCFTSGSGCWQSDLSSPPSLMDHWHSHLHEKPHLSILAYPATSSQPFGEQTALSEHGELRSQSER